MCIAYGLQGLHSLLEHIAPVFQNLYLIFEDFNEGYIIVCAL